MALGTPYPIAGPAYLAASATDIYTPPASTLYTYITQIHLANVTSGAVTYTLYVGATGGSAGGHRTGEGCLARGELHDGHLLQPREGDEEHGLPERAGLGGIVHHDHGARLSRGDGRVVTIRELPPSECGR